MKYYEKIAMLTAICMALFAILSLEKTNASCMTDGECYDYYSYEVNNETYTNYWYNWKTYRILVPNTRQEFIRLEYKYIRGEMKTSHKFYNTVKLNILLVKLWLEPLYY